LIANAAVSRRRGNGAAAATIVEEELGVVGALEANGLAAVTASKILTVVVLTHLRVVATAATAVLKVALTVEVRGQASITEQRIVG
jgi:hypothetical protein